MNAEAIRSGISEFLSSFSTTVDTVYCLDERALFSNSYRAVFRGFPPSDALMELRNRCYELSGVFPGKKVHAHPKCMDAITLPADCCVFSRFGLGLSAAIHSAD